MHHSVAFRGDLHDVLRQILDVFVHADPDFTYLTVADFVAQMMWCEMSSDTREYVEDHLDSALKHSRSFPEGVHRTDEAAK
jgi:hypothetical protein